MENHARTCAACGSRPSRSPVQAYCKPCAAEKDLASARARRQELKDLRIECARLKALLLEKVR
jgi:hypothetical protein